MCAADLHEAFAHFRPDHADNEQMGIAAFDEWVQRHRHQFTARSKHQPSSVGSQQATADWRLPTAD
jgi:hypothetical protein